MDLADVDATVAKKCLRGIDVGDDDLQALYRARLGVGDAATERDGARRTRWRQLDETDVVAHLVVVVGVEADLLDVKGLRAIDVSDGNRDEFELPIHVHSPCSVKAFDADRRGRART